MIRTCAAIFAVILSTSQLDLVAAGATQVVKPAKGAPQTVKGLQGSKVKKIDGAATYNSKGKK